MIQLLGGNRQSKRKDNYKGCCWEGRSSWPLTAENAPQNNSNEDKRADAGGLVIWWWEDEEVSTSALSLFSTNTNSLTAEVSIFWAIVQENPFELVSSPPPVKDKAREVKNYTGLISINAVSLSAIITSQGLETEILSFLIITFQRNGFEVLENDIPGL